MKKPVAEVRRWEAGLLGPSLFCAEVSVIYQKFLLVGSAITNTSGPKALAQAIVNAVGIFSEPEIVVRFHDREQINEALLNEPENLVKVCQQVLEKEKEAEMTKEQPIEEEERLFEGNNPKLFAKFMACSRQKEAIEKKLNRAIPDGKKSALLYHLRNLEQRVIPGIIESLSSFDSVARKGG